MKLKNKKGFTSLLEAGAVILLMPILIYAIGTLATKAYSIYNNYKIKNYVLSENVKLSKALGGIRFANGIDFIDETPLNHENLSHIKLTLPDSKTIEFKPEDLGTDTNDIVFLNTLGEEIYMYNKDFIDLKKFKITVLDNTINRSSVKIDIKMGIDGKNNKIARTKFGNKEYYLDYSMTYTLRNNTNN